MALLVIRVAFVLLAGYFLGAIPWALLVGRWFFGLDPREHGSGNLGATNVFRVMGARAGAATLLLDAAKGSAAVGLSMLIVPPSLGPSLFAWTRVLAMVAAVLGHSYSPYVKFGGGKGVATSAGGLLVLSPLAFLIELVLFVLVLVFSRMVSLGSVVAAFVYPLLVLWLYPGDTPLLVAILGLASLVVWRHRGNIRRIVRGEESKISMSRRGVARTRAGEGDDPASEQADEKGSAS